jgi:putative hydrolase of HD superfamily
MAKIDLDRVLEFDKLLQAFARVERVAHITGRKARESDAEHSYAMAMMAWYITDVFALPLNKDRVIQYALVHDLVEVYAGDTYIFDAEAKKTKVAREAAALEKIKEDFREFPSLAQTIEVYEKQNDSESQFVKSLDKVLPMLTNYRQGGSLWREMNASFSEAVAYKRDKVPEGTELRALLEEIIARIEPHKGDYFPR